MRRLIGALIAALLASVPLLASPLSAAAPPATGVWQNVTPTNMSMATAIGGCGSFGTTTVVGDPLRPSDLYANANCQGVWKSTDYGQTWVGPINTGPGGSSFTDGTGWMSSGPGPAGGPPDLYMSYIRGPAQGMWKSTDGGVSWTQRISGVLPSRRDLWPPAVDPYDRNHLLMTGHEQDVLYQSFDGGLNWATLTLPAGMLNQPLGCTSNQGCVAFINTGSATSTRGTWLYESSSSGGAFGTWRTTNAGATWVRVDRNEGAHGPLAFYQPDTSGVVYMAGVYSTLGWGVLRSADYGQTWAHVGAGTGEAIVWGTPSKIYAAYSWACQGCTVSLSLQTAPTPGVTGWALQPDPAGMAIGPAAEVTTFDGSNYVFVTANWLAGLWRYVEPSSGPAPTPTTVPVATATATTVPPTPTATATSVPTSTATATATATPTTQPTATVAPTVVPTSTPTPASVSTCEVVVIIDDAATTVMRPSAFCTDQP